MLHYGTGIAQEAVMFHMKHSTRHQFPARSEAAQTYNLIFPDIGSNVGADVQNYIKRLRKYLYKQLGSYETLHFYAVGEYGPVHFRPHYHKSLKC
jgi:hypothetical protein